jgi:CRISP-associated protein Cas1
VAKEISGAKPVPLGQLVRAQDRLSFLYLEHCVVHRDANAITARDVKGTDTTGRRSRSKASR